MRVALLGTGKMGAAIARRLQAAGHDLTLWNRTADRARAVGAGRVAADLGDAVAEAEVVLSILFDPDSVRETYLRLEPRRGQVYVDSTTAGPEVHEELAPRLEAAGASLLAAPILGSIPAIEEGGALILVGGEAAAFEKAGPVLEAFGKPEYVGSRREAAGLKLLNNAMLGVTTAAAAELLATASREGLDLEAAFRLLSRSVPYLTARRRGFLERDHSRPNFDVGGMVKDLDLALGLGHGAGAAMPTVAQVRELFGLAAPEHGGHEITSVIEVFSR
jgi:3-hydroxyisobutyrate dehydrogenase-like beta-hydroxyacid dehydrogenase